MKLPPRLVLATSNPGKVAEWVALLSTRGVQPVVLADLDAPEEAGATYEANALIKARAACVGADCPALGDDVGLEVDALNGDPGMGTKRWAMTRGGWAQAQRELGRLAEGSPATYLCGLAIAWPDGRTHTALGHVTGRIVPPVSSGPGFENGFVPQGASTVLSQLSPALRVRFHHRCRALTALVDG